MIVTVAEKCGFCPGVRNAISIAEKVLADESEVYSLGSIIHNKEVVEQLSRAGLKTVDDPDQINTGTVLIRSHGAAPAEIAKLRQRGLEIVDATCVLVKRVQRIAEQFDHEGLKVVVIGDKDHPEVQAVVGCARDVAVIADDNDLHKLSSNGKFGIVCQTTKGMEYFSEVLAAITQHGFSELKVVNTLCKETIQRQQCAVELCKKVDLMFVLGDLTSANTRTLARLCKKYNKNTFHLQNWKEFDINRFPGKKTAGVTAGASTPEWIIDEFAANLRKLGKEQTHKNTPAV